MSDDLPAHAHCGPSSSDGWLNCCAYATLTRGLHRKATYYTREGSAAHKVCELMLDGQSVPEFIEIEGEVILVSDEMIEYCEVYVQYARLLMFGAAYATVEKRVSLQYLYEPLAAPETVFGTADLIVYDAVTKTLHVVDFKYGSGHIVNVKRNTQLMLYALMALGLLAEMPLTIVITIVQPRAAKNIITSDTLTLTELMEWFQDTVKPALARIGAGDTSENPGDWCRWCLRVANCESLHKKAQSVAKLSFSGETQSPPEPHTLTPSDITKVLENAEMISAWVSKVRAEAIARIEAGETLPGWKCVAKKGVRKWVDEKITEDVLYALYGVAIFEKQEIRSPAQMEKAIKKIGGDPRDIDPFVTKESSGVTLVRDTDEREEKQVLRIPASSVFEAIE